MMADILLDNFGFMAVVVQWKPRKVARERNVRKLLSQEPNSKRKKEERGKWQEYICFGDVSGSVLNHFFFGSASSGARLSGSVTPYAIASNNEASSPLR